jgi:hypothetical protein
MAVTALRGHATRCALTLACTPQTGWSIPSIGVAGGQASGGTSVPG